MALKLPEIFLDKKNRYIYYNHKEERAFEIPKSEFKKYNAFHNRLIVAIAIGAMIPVLFELKIIYMPIIGILTYGFLELIWRNRLFPRLKEIPNYNYKKSYVQIRRTNSKLVDISKTILYFIAGVIIIYLSFTDPKYESIEVVVMLAFGIFTLLLGLKSIFDLIKRND